MSLRLRIVIFILLLNVCTLAFVNYFSRSILLTNLDKVEADQMTKDLKLVKRSLEIKQASLERFVQDYSYWDDTYSFMSEFSEDYVESNLISTTFANLEIDYIVMMDTAGQLYFKRGFDHVSGNSLEFTENMLTALEKLSNLINVQHYNGNGFFVVDGEVYLSANRTILKSNKEGPPAGTLMFIRKLDDTLINDVREATQQNFTISSYVSVKETFTKSAVASLLDRGVLVENTKSSIKGSHLVDELYGDPAFAINIQSEKYIYRRGQDLVTKLNVVTIVAAGVMLILAMSYMELIYIGPLRRLLTQINLIKTKKGAGQRITVKTVGELGYLVDNINSFLETVDASDSQLVNINSQLQQKAKEVEENSKEVERLNRHMVGRELRMAELKEQMEDLKFKLSLREKDVNQ